MRTPATYGVQRCRIVKVRAAPPRAVAWTTGGKNGCNSRGPATALGPRSFAHDRADQGLRQRRAEAHRARIRSTQDTGGTRDRPAGGTAPTGVLLRHAGSGAEQERRGAARPPSAEERR